MCACSFEVHASPKARFRCHCLICQAFNGTPFADVVAVRAKDVVLKNAGNISFANIVCRRTSTGASVAPAASRLSKLQAPGRSR
jgi:hypothetical protein